MAPKKKISAALKKAVWIKYFKAPTGEGKCRYCQCSISPFDFEADHIIPESKGGSTNLNNLQPSCRTCNASRGNKDIDIFIRQFQDLTLEPKERIIIEDESDESDGDDDDRNVENNITEAEDNDNSEEEDYSSESSCGSETEEDSDYDGEDEYNRCFGITKLGKRCKNRISIGKRKYCNLHSKC